MSTIHDNDNQQRPTGLYAALITPVDDEGRPDLDRLADLIDFVVDAGVDGLCIGGGTAEYPHFELKDRKAIVEKVAVHLETRVPFVTAIGAPTVRGVLELGEHALEAGSTALLLPMPFFYRYEQQDLDAYVHHVVKELAAPCLLYNLAAFTNALDPSTSLALLRSEPQLIGIKDSSGDERALPLFADIHQKYRFSLLCGSDGLFLKALNAGWDGAISGIASCCPEVFVALYRHYRAGRQEEARRCQNRIDELIDMVSRLPFPWSIRVAAEVRGIPNGPLPYPPGEERKGQISELKDEYARWFDEHSEFLESGYAEKRS